MSWGLEVWDGSGHLLVDGASQMMRLHHEANVTLSSDGIVVSFSGLSEKPLVMVSPKDSIDHPMWRPEKSDTLWDQVRIWGKDDNQAEVFVFKRTSGSASGWGLQCRSSAGETIIDGASKMLRLHARFTGQLSSGSPVTHSFTSLGYIPPVILTKWTTFWSPLDQTFSGFRTVGFKVADGSITLDWCLIGVIQDQISGGDDSGDYDVYVFAYQ